MKILSVGRKLYIIVLLIFIVLLAVFIALLYDIDMRYHDKDMLTFLFSDWYYILPAVFALIILNVILHKFVNRLTTNITKLITFANSADENKMPNEADLTDFPDDELGDIAKRLIRMYKQLQDTRLEQDRLKRELTQNMAHELKTPVASIQGYLETIIDNPGINIDTKNQFIQRCYAQTERLTALLNDISTLNRTDAALNVIEFDDINVYEMVSEIQKEVALQLRERGMVMHNLMSYNVVVRGDKSAIYSVFRNLIDNAIAYAGDKTTIKLTATEDKYFWHFTFSDNGIGVPQKSINRIFERFYRVDTGRSRKMGGTGLGLAIVKNTILQYGGSIFANNNDNGGLRFDFSLRK